MATLGAERVDYRVVPDDREELAAALVAMCEAGTDLILSSGGTGLSPRDVTPEATADVADRMVPGIPEAIRAASMAATSRAMLSRGIAAIRGRTLIVNLPGSPKAVRECLTVVLPVLDHAVEVLRGEVGDCAR